MNEAIHDGVNGLLVGSHANGTAKSGIPALDPDVGDLRRAIERLADDARRRRAGGRGAFGSATTERAVERHRRGDRLMLETAANG